MPAVGTMKKDYLQGLPTSKAPAPTSGYTDINNIKQSDVLPQYQAQMGFSSNNNQNVMSAATPDQAAILKREAFYNSPQFASSVIRGFWDPIKAGMNNPRSTEEQIGETIGAMGTAATLMGPIVGLKGPSLIKNTKALNSLMNKNKLSNVVKVGTAASKADKIASNSKNVKLTGKMLSKFFSPKALALYGGAAGSLMLGRWAQSESAEPLSFQLNPNGELMQTAMETGDWSIVEDAQSARDEILDLETWEKIGLWTPFSPFIGISNKIKGAIEGARINDAIIKDMKTAQVNGEDESAMWARVNAENSAREQAQIDYYNNQRILTEKTILDLRAKAQKETNAAAKKSAEEQAALWEAYAERQRKAEEKAREESAKFWLEYQKELLKFREGTNNTRLNFGLL